MLIFWKIQVKKIQMEKQIIIFCPDCRGKFDVNKSDIVEDDMLECPLCGAELVVLQEDPIKLRLVDPEEDDFF